MPFRSFRMTFLVLISLVAVAQSFAVAADEPEPASEGRQVLRVVSYNIKRGLGNDGRTDLQRTAGVLRSLNPDFVGLQEVDENARRSGSVDQAIEMGKQLKMHHAFAPFMDFDGGRYGLAVLSRHPINGITVVKLPTGNEPRVALAAEILLPDESTVMLVNLHFDWVKDDQFRFAQATALKAYLDKLTVPYILMGDFNDVPSSRTLKLMREGCVEATKPADDPLTFSATKPTIEIDFIFAAPEAHWKFDTVDVIHEPMASDHRPVYAELSVQSAP